MIVAWIINAVLIVPLAVMSLADFALSALDAWVVPLLASAGDLAAPIGYVLGILGPKPVAVISLFVHALDFALIVVLSWAAVISVTKLAYGWLIVPLPAALRGRTN